MPSLALPALGARRGRARDEWRRIRAGEVGRGKARGSPSTAPLADLGLVIVDEEHDPAYKTDRIPGLQARDLAPSTSAARRRPRRAGSATPAVVTASGRAIAGPFAPPTLVDGRSVGRRTVEVVDLRVELAAGNRGLLSAALADALAALDTAGGEQAILVINRRGSARWCSVATADTSRLPRVPAAARLHAAAPWRSAAITVERQPRRPRVAVRRVARPASGTWVAARSGWSRRSAPGSRRCAWRRLDRDVAERGVRRRRSSTTWPGRTDVLVGTSLVTKGLDVPQVTLVGVVSADVALTLPDERAAERTWQLLAQAVGRAGRGDHPGRAIIQTYLPDHPAIRAVADGRCPCVRGWRNSTSGVGSVRRPTGVSSS